MTTYYEHNCPNWYFMPINETRTEFLGCCCYESDGIADNFRYLLMIIKSYANNFNKNLMGDVAMKDDKTETPLYINCQDIPDPQITWYLRLEESDGEIFEVHQEELIELIKYVRFLKANDEKAGDENLKNRGNDDA